MSQQTILETKEISDTKTPQRFIRTTTRVIPARETQTSGIYKTKETIFRTYQVLFYVLGLIEILLVFRLILKLIGASQISGFTRFIYSLSGPFATPFFGVIPMTVSGGSVMEWSTLIAMAVYAVVVWLIVELFQLVKPINPQEVEETVDHQ